MHSLIRAFVPRSASTSGDVSIFRVSQAVEIEVGGTSDWATLVDPPMTSLEIHTVVQTNGQV